MFKKIDKRLFEKIRLSSKCDSLTPVIIKLGNYKKDILKLENKYKNLIKLPFLSSVVIELNLCEIESFAKHKFVKYISDSQKVCSLMYNTKNFLGVDEFVGSNNTFALSNVAIIDTGIYPHIDFLLGRNRVVKFVDLINRKTKMYDDNGHGTFVAGVINGWGIVNKYGGIDKKCGLIVIKALDKNGETDSGKILEAMQWVLDNKEKYNITTVCMSFGSLRRSNDPLVRGVGILWKNGIVVVTAGGNSGPQYDTILSPGSSRRVITVGSLDDMAGGKMSVADFSSRGPVDGYYKPDLVVPGTNITSTTIFDKNEKKFYTTMSGTSVSTPMVAGVASILKSINPNYTPDQIKYMILSACKPIESDRNKEGFGYLDLRNLKLF